MYSTVKFIFFDVGNTLLFPDRETIHRPLTQRGIRIDPERLRDLERRIKNEFDALMMKDGHDHGFWMMFYTQLLKEIGLHDHRVRDELVTSIRNSANWNQILPGTREELQKIAKRYQIAVISNADGRIDQVLGRCDIADCFLTITDSGNVGREKPHPEIFRQALASLNAAPEESLYIGDVYSVDYLGATGAGLRAILMDVSGAYREKGVPRVESLVELRAALQSQDS